MSSKIFSKINACQKLVDHFCIANDTSNISHIIQVLSNVQDLSLRELSNYSADTLTEDLENAIKDDIKKVYGNNFFTDVQGFIYDIISSVTSSRWGMIGGYGHHVYITYGGYYRHDLNIHPHWVIRDGCYEKVKLTDFENLILGLKGCEIRISPKAEYERWGN